MTSRFYKSFVLSIIPLIILFGVTGCTQGGESEPVPHLTPCNDTANTFYQPPRNINTIIAASNIPSFDSNSLLNRQAEAVGLLVHEVKKWSVPHDVVQNDVVYRFTVTLLSPELVLAVILAENASLGRPATDSIAQLDQWMKERQENQRILFLLTVNTSDQDTITRPNQQSFYVPIENMILGVMGGLRTGQPHGECIFDYNLDPYDEPLQHYFCFSAAVMYENTCTPLLDPNRDLSFALGMNAAQINQTVVENMTWNFNLNHIVNVGHETDPYPLPANEIVSPDKIANLTLPSCQMPKPVIKTDEMSITEEIIYWMNFSLCVWHHFAGGN